jgi:hypothetical protein
VTAGVPGTRLDERVIGAGTNTRFALLLLLLVVTSGYMLLPELSDLHPAGNMTACELAAGVDVDHAAEIPSVLRTTGQMMAYFPCLARYAPAPPWWQILVGPPIVIAAAVILFRLLPVWKRRRSRCVLLDRLSGGAEIRADVTRLAEGRVPVPELFVAPASRGMSGAVFGTNGRPCLCLDGGLVAVRESDPDTFEAVVLHELGHIANRDLTVTYATVALWRTFVVLVIAPYMVQWAGLLRLIGTNAGDLPTFDAQTLRDLALPVVTTAVIYFVRAEVLRSRELYADLTADRWGAELGRVWAAMPSRGDGSLLLAPLFDQLRIHPRRQVRRSILQDPTPLFSVSLVLMFLTGVTAAMLGFQLTGYFVPHMEMLSPWLDQAIVAVPAAVVAAVVTVVLWRATVHAALCGRPAPTGVRAGVWLGLGMVAGFLANGEVTGDLWLPRRGWVLALIVGAAVAFTCWASQCARLAVASWPGRSLRWPLGLCMAAGLLILAALLVWWNYYGSMYADGFWYEQAGMRQAVVHWFPGTGTVRPDLFAAIAQPLYVLRYAAWQPLTPAAAVAAWTVPFGLWAWNAAQRRPGWLRSFGRTGAEAAATDSAIDSTAWQVPALRQAFVPAATGTVTTVLGVIAIQAWLHHLHVPPGRHGGVYALSYAVWSLGAIVTGMLVAASISAASSSFRLVTALAAGGLSALLGLVGATVLISADGCVPSLAVLNTSCTLRPAWQELQGGAVFALVAHLALFLAPVTGAVVVAAGSAVRAVREANRAKGSASAPATAAAGPVGPGGHGGRAALAAVAVPALALALAAVLMDGDAASQLVTAAQATTTSEANFQQAAGLPVLPVPQDMRWEQVHAWYQLGGRYLLDHAVADSNALTALLRPALQDNRPLVELTDQFRPICQGLWNVASWEPGAYFQIPDPGAEASWHQYGVEALQGGQDCLGAVSARNTQALVRSLIELLSADKSVIAASDRVEAIIDDPSDAVYQGQPTEPPQPRL